MLIRIRNRNNFKIASCQGCVICTILQKWFYLAEKTEKAFKVPGNLLFVYKPSTASVVEPVQLCPGSALKVAPAPQHWLWYLAASPYLNQNSSCGVPASMKVGSQRRVRFEPMATEGNNIHTRLMTQKP